MNDLTKGDLEEALRAVTSMITKTGKLKFAQGTSQHTLQKNRLKALDIASSLISKELAGDNSIDRYTKDDLEKAAAPIDSLISKSEKAQKNLEQGSWQNKMLGDNLKALYVVKPLLTKAVSWISPQNEQIE